MNKWGEYQTCKVVLPYSDGFKNPPAMKNFAIFPRDIPCV